MENNIRKMVTIRMIDDLQPIKDADRIEVATVGGWKVVVQKGNFQVGDLGLYLEIDSWVPSTLDPSLSRGKEPREYNGVKGEKLRTIRLRKQLSQGLMIPLRPEILEKFAFNIENLGWHIESGGSSELIHPENIEDLSKIDLSELLGVQKWERVLDACLQGKARGNFPSFLLKTDQERAQNIRNKIFEETKDTRYEVTLKMDGSSMTVYNKAGYVGVCSRNLDLDMTDDSNAMVRLAINSGLVKRMESMMFVDTAIQGEICGPGIQGNKDNLTTQTFFLFDTFDIKTGEYQNPTGRQEDFAHYLQLPSISHAPILHKNVTLAEIGITNMEELLKFAEQPGYNSKWAEGVVFKSEDGQFSFKVISNKYLEQETD